MDEDIPASLISDKVHHTQINMHNTEQQIGRQTVVTTEGFICPTAEDQSNSIQNTMLKGQQNQVLRTQTKPKLSQETWSYNTEHNIHTNNNNNIPTQLNDGEGWGAE